MLYQPKETTHKTMTARTKPVSSFLSASPNAEALAQLDLGFGRSATLWRNQDDHVSYEDPEGHTFSFYLRGGMGTWRRDGTPAHGWPGAVCVMPQGQNSVWDINEPFVFVHLYVPDAELRRAYSQAFDRDARSLELVDRTYVEAQELAAPFGRLVAGLRDSDVAIADDATVDLVSKVLSSGKFGESHKVPLSGGLTQRNTRQLQDYIEAHLEHPIYLRDLAALVDLSEFHLQRSFRASCGVSPQAWIAARRVERAKSLIRGDEPLAQVAAACGFASQSHLTRAFRNGTGVTPGAWRRAVVS